MGFQPYFRSSPVKSGTGRAWIWPVVVLIVGKVFAMFMLGSRSFTQFRKSVGLPYFRKFHLFTPRAFPAINRFPVSKRVCGTL
jgi:hypothetical protein